MGSASRKRPQKLGDKLKSIRLHFEASFTQMAEKLSDEEIIVLRTDVSRYEKNLREPSLLILLRYAKLAGTTMDVLTDDNMDFSM